MAFLGAALPLVGGVVGSLLFGGSKKAAAPAAISAPQAPTRNLAAEMARRSDMLRRRRGGRANEYAGDSGGATPAAKAMLGPSGA